MTKRRIQSRLPVRSANERHAPPGPISRWAPAHGSREKAGAQKGKPRRGAVLVAALALVAVVAMIGAGLARSAMLQRQQSLVQPRRLQAMWLAESAVARAAAQLRLSNDYQGETWRLSLDDLAQAQAGVAVIEVRQVANSPNRRRIHVEAAFPDHPVRRVAYIQESIVEISTDRKEPQS